MTDEQRPERADILPVMPDARLPLDGDFYNRMIRSIHAMLQYNPEQIPGSGVAPRLKFGPQVNYEALILDASGAPFRANGKMVSGGENGGAPGAGFNSFFGVQNIFSYDGKSPYTILMVDTVLLSAQLTQVQVSVQGFPAGTGYTSKAMSDFEVSTGARGAFLGAGVPSKPVIQQLLTSAVGANVAVGTGIPGSVWGYIDSTQARGPIPIGIPVFPGEEFDLYQVTSALAFSCTVTGRLWTFGPQVPQGSP